MVPNSIWLVSLEEKSEMQGEDDVKMKAEMGVIQLQAKECLGWWETERKGESALRGFGGNPALLTPWFQTSGLQNWERIHYSSLTPPACGTLLWRPHKCRITPRIPKDWLHGSLAASCMVGIHLITRRAREGLVRVQTRGGRGPGSWQSISRQNPIWLPFSGVPVIPVRRRGSLEFATWLSPSGSNPCLNVTSSEWSSPIVTE